ncbi:hypothetical protein MNEG_13850 [Monoraphidium neglectum]|uniref:[Acyl-carrier-protein] S-malonyltransferase n=1 Tax=Monoraphidium neglectum TaxID=145388 RepID=A0A0D2KE84_9CHLO|nr:hypothetical protein MNEG_13850 [Monoraphidium neglectum]KIY94113.1 hypothetical protein MNEG_13850 [Monoraphidium neglectum]|eukprot:XP_013893133.1 hypothetical protein MNEG_13850 [Monoraphidium neglectum]
MQSAQMQRRSAGPAQPALRSTYRPARAVRANVRASAVAEQATADAKFADYKPTTAFLFPGQGAQSVGMAKSGRRGAPAPAAAPGMGSGTRCAAADGVAARRRRGRPLPAAACGGGRGAAAAHPLGFGLLCRQHGQGPFVSTFTADLVEECPAAKELFDKASAILGYDLLQVCVEGPKEKLDTTAVSQPAIYVASLAAVEKVRATDPAVLDAVDVAAGLSLGEYTALTFAGELRELCRGLLPVET